MRRSLAMPAARRARVGPAIMLTALAFIGCTPTVKVQAPDKPIEINLNIRVEQEVRIKIDRELDQLFRDNPDLFGLPAPVPPAAGTAAGETRR